MKKPKFKGWIEDIPEYDPSEEDLDLDLPRIPQLKRQKKQLKNGNTKRDNLFNKDSSKRRSNYR